MPRWLGRCSLSFAALDIVARPERSYKAGSLRPPALHGYLCQVIAASPSPSVPLKLPGPREAAPPNLVTSRYPATGPLLSASWVGRSATRAQRSASRIGARRLSERARCQRRLRLSKGKCASLI